jgi:hypothetical protein
MSPCEGAPDYRQLTRLPKTVIRESRQRKSHVTHPSKAFNEGVVTGRLLSTRRGQVKKMIGLGVLVAAKITKRWTSEPGGVSRLRPDSTRGSSPVDRYRNTSSERIKVELRSVVGAGPSLLLNVQVCAAGERRKRCACRPVEADVA